MTQESFRFGIYLNVREGKVVRISSPYWKPGPPDWVLVTQELNATLLSVRDIIREQHLYESPQDVAWGQVPLRE